MADYPDDLRRLVEEYLEGLRFSDAATTGLDEAMRYSLLAGGKRIRPVLCLAAARSAGTDPAEVLPAAAAIELIHTYSLIHDDLPAMDDDELRRGRPTSHVVYGEAVAILAGDGLFAEAIRLFCERQEGEPSRVLAALAELTRATGAGGMVGGQYVDVTAADGLDAEGLRELHMLKTGRLIAASVAVPLLIAGVDEERMRAYRRFADELGVLFQIVDDILDVTGSDEELGKPHGSDERHGKVTYVSLFGLERARELAPSRTPTPARRSPRSRARPPTWRWSRTSSAPARPETERGAATIRASPDDRDPRQRRAGAPARLDRGPRRPPRPLRRGAGADRAGGPRADHRHDRRDRRPLRRQPRHLRADHGAARAARLAARQDPLGRRPSGLPAQGAHRPRRPPGDDPPVRGPGAVLLGVRVRARHHGRRPRLDLDRLRGRAQGGDAPRDRRGRQGRRGDRRRRAHRRGRVRGAPQRRRPADADRDRPQRQRDVDLAQRRRDRPLVPAPARQPAPLPRARGGREQADQAAARPRRHDRAPRARDQVGDQGLRRARSVLRGARPRLHGAVRRPRRHRAAREPRGGAGRRPPGGRPHPHGQGQGVRARRGGRPRGDGEVARGEARLDRRGQAGAEEARRQAAADPRRDERGRRARRRPPSRRPPTPRSSATRSWSRRSATRG